MWWMILPAVLAGFGVLTLLWALFGWLLPVCREGWVLCPGKAGRLEAVYALLWLRWMGLLRCRLLVLDRGLAEGEKSWLLRKNVEIYSPGEWIPGLCDGVEEL